MLRSLGSMRTTVLINCGNHSQLTTAVADDVIKAVAREITGDFGWSTRRREALITTIAPYTTGTVAASAGSSTVTGTGTTWPVFTSHRRLSIGSIVPLRVTWVSTTSLTLVDPQGTAVSWPSASVTGQSYSLFLSE